MTDRIEEIRARHNADDALFAVFSDSEAAENCHNDRGTLLTELDRLRLELSGADACLEDYEKERLETKEELARLRSLTKGGDGEGRALREATIEECAKAVDDSLTTEQWNFDGHQMRFHILKTIRALSSTAPSGGNMEDRPAGEKE